MLSVTSSPVVTAAMILAGTVIVLAILATGVAVTQYLGLGNKDEEPQKEKSEG